MLPQLWFRNTWSWGYPGDKPEMMLDDDVVVARESRLGTYRLYRESGAPWLFTENETNGVRLFGQTDDGGHIKDAFHDFVVQEKFSAINQTRPRNK